VRKLSPLERGDIFRQHNVYSKELDSVIYGVRRSGLLPTHVIEFRVKWSRENAPRIDSHERTALCAFYLYGFSLAGPGMLTLSILPTWNSFGRSGAPVPMKTIIDGIPPKELTESDISEIHATLTALGSYDLHAPTDPHALALHRFFEGSGRDNQVDALLDYTIALECLLLPYDRGTRQADLSYRFRLHGAHFIAETAAERQAVWDQLKAIYELRSRLVHGSRYPVYDEIRTNLDTARDLAQRGLLRALRSGFPTAEEFNRLTLGAIAAANSCRRGSSISPTPPTMA
jgi:hypothetical protein